MSNLEESMKLISTHEHGKHTAKVYKNSDLGEHQVKFYTNGKHHVDADYHTDDKEDAEGTAKDQIKSMKESVVASKSLQEFLDSKQLVGLFEGGETSNNTKSKLPYLGKIEKMTADELADAHAHHTLHADESEGDNNNNFKRHTQAVDAIEHAVKNIHGKEALKLLKHSTNAMNTTTDNGDSWDKTVSNREKTIAKLKKTMNVYESLDESLDEESIVKKGMDHYNKKHGTSYNYNDFRSHLVGGSSKDYSKLLSHIDKHYPGEYSDSGEKHMKSAFGLSKNEVSKLLKLSEAKTVDIEESVISEDNQNLIDAIKSDSVEDVKRMFVQLAEKHITKSIELKKRIVAQKIFKKK